MTEDGSFINSIVGEGTAFRGELLLSGLLRIDGDFTGSIRTSGKILVGKNGRAECTIRANTVVIGGVVKGNIFAEEKVIVLSTGMMIGNIHSPRLIAEEGVILNGNCLISKEESKVDRAKDLGSPTNGDTLSFFSQGFPEERETAKANVFEGNELSSWKG